MTGPLETHVLPGNHYSLLRDGAQALAARLRQAMAGYDRPKAPSFSTLSHGLLHSPRPFRAKTRRTKRSWGAHARTNETRTVAPPKAHKPTRAFER